MKRLCIAAASALGLSLLLSACGPVGGMQPASPSGNNAPYASGSSGSDGGGGGGGGTGY